MSQHFRPDRLSVAAMTDAADRFREWSRTPEAVVTLQGVCEGSFSAENELISAFVTAIHPEDA